MLVLYLRSARVASTRESARRDLTTAFASRSDTVALNLAHKVGGEEEMLWRRLVTARTALEESEREESRARRDLEDVLASLQDAVLVVDSEARLRFLNAAALRLFDVRIESVLGAHLIEALPSFGIDAAMRSALREGQSSAQEIHLYSPKLREVFLRVAPVYSGAGLSAGAVAILQDLTELRRLERVRRDFVANASHELRTPIANIRATAETMLHAPEDAALVARFLPPLISEAERLSRLVSDLLDLARAEGVERAPFEPVELQQVVQNAIERLQESAARREIAISFQATKNPGIAAPVVLGDSAGLEQVAFNLLDNALAYTPSGGNVALDLREIEEGETKESGEIESRALAILEVRDTGIGIPSADLPRIFERFYRVDKARSRAEGGTGLGLAIVKHIVENHGGHVEVLSEMGVGTTFRVELPLL
ncbi:PAS domain S-box-containing protein [Abditibacterium utsteinense]|uniref:histidine kinase n=2 Tax=Abditibacterium utsteinense TaxID=1960156 RepID=A0A2S8SVN0_9BACT|nr:PAS domain S-box-containing protein [Abditibacterium utsteinense]